MNFSQFPNVALSNSTITNINISYTVRLVVIIMCTSLRILQQSVDFCEIAVKGLKILSSYEEADIIAVQDLACRDGNYDRVFAPYRVATSQKIGDTALAAIAVVNSDLQVCDVEELCTKYCVCVSIDSQLGDLYVLNVCLPASDEIDEALEVIDKIIRQLEGEMFVVTVNTNAKSVWWSCIDKSDERGGKIEDFILRHTLCVLNCKDPLGEQWTPDGHSDVTLSSSSVVNTVMKWNALPDVDGNRVARTDLMLQNLEYRRKPKKCVKKKIQRLDWVVEEDKGSIFGFEDNSLTSFEGSTSRWSEADVDKVGVRMEECTLMNEVGGSEDSSLNKSV